jgi:hypothetical protein
MASRRRIAEERERRGSRGDDGGRAPPAAAAAAAAAAEDEDEEDVEEKDATEEMDAAMGHNSAVVNEIYASATPSSMPVTAGGLLEPLLGGGGVSGTEPPFFVAPPRYATLSLCSGARAKRFYPIFFHFVDG